MIKQNYAVNKFNFSTFEQAELFENIITKNKFNNKQKKIIASGIKKGLDVSIYSFKYFKAEQMKQVQLGLEKGLNISSYLNPDIDWEEMRRIRLELQDKK